VSVQAPSTPYDAQPEKAFWRSAVADKSLFDIEEVYSPKFDLWTAKVATAGSCFAQHIGGALRKAGLAYLDVEPPPPMLPAQCQGRYGYGLFSARYGNIYNTRQLVQLFDRAFGNFRPSETAWETGGRWADPFRPTIEPGGFESQDELEECRSAHFSAVRRLFESLEVLVFTLGLTETWISAVDGAAYPMCPGTAAGTFDSTKYRFVNLRYAEIRDDLEQFMRRVHSINPGAKFLLTVSPVPLTATATKNHVISATMYSKSVLRAVAGDLCDALDCVDYFPSYELIAGTAARGTFFEPNMRAVSAAGVAYVMSKFFPHRPADTAVATAGQNGAEPPIGRPAFEYCDEAALGEYLTR